MAIEHRKNRSNGIAYDDAGNVFAIQPMSAMGWLRFYTGGGNPSTAGHIINVWGAAGERSWVLGTTASPLEYFASISKDGTDQFTTNSAVTIGTNVFNHVGMDWDGVDLRVYLNGVLDAESDQTGTIHVPTQDLGIGNNGDGTGSGADVCDVQTEDVRVYDRILTAAEWLTIFNSMGNDGIVTGLLFRMTGNDRRQGVVVTTKNPLDVGPNDVAMASSFGSPVSGYFVGTGFGFK